MENINSYLSFKIGKEVFAANVKFVHSIIKVPRITVIPDSYKYMLGVINHRGKVLPVIDLRIKLETIHKEINSDTCIVVMELTIENEQVFIGALVDSVIEVLKIKQNEIKNSSLFNKNLEKKFIIGVYEFNEKFAMILDMNKIMDDDSFIFNKAS